MSPDSFYLSVIVIVFLIKSRCLEANLPITNAFYNTRRLHKSMLFNRYQPTLVNFHPSHGRTTNNPIKTVHKLLQTNIGKHIIYVDNRRKNNERTFLSVIPQTVVPVASKILTYRHENFPTDQQSVPKSFPPRINFKKIHYETTINRGNDSHSRKAVDSRENNDNMTTNVRSATSIENISVENVAETRRKLPESIDSDGEENKFNNLHEISKSIKTPSSEGEISDPLKLKNMNLSNAFMNATEDIANATRVNKIFEKFVNSLEQLERKFYWSTFTKLSNGVPTERRENGISFVQSGLFLHLALTALSSTVGKDSQTEIEACSNFSATEKEKTDVINRTVSWLPRSDADLKFRWSNRLILAPGVNVSEEFQQGTAKALEMHIDHLNGTDDPVLLAKTLNKMIESDSGGSMHDTFDDDELTGDVSSVLLSTLYLRGQWLSPPTLLNDSRRFFDVPEDNDMKTTRMIRINDIVKYADLTEWDAEAVEIPYRTPGLSLLVVVPRGHTLRPLSQRLGAGAGAGLRDVIARMTTRRIAVTMPLYTLRMTLLLPNKLRDMGVRSLVAESPLDNNTTTADKTLRITHAVQRIMFWAEAGRNAYKEDGIEWDDPPEMELMVDRPYAFFVRWRNVTLMNGHFVL